MFLYYVLRLWILFKPVLTAFFFFFFFLYHSVRGGDISLHYRKVEVEVQVPHLSSVEDCLLGGCSLLLPGGSESSSYHVVSTDSAVGMTLLPVGSGESPDTPVGSSDSTQRGMRERGFLLLLERGGSPGPQYDLH